MKPELARQLAAAKEVYQTDFDDVTLENAEACWNALGKAIGVARALDEELADTHRRWEEAHRAHGARLDGIHAALTRAGVPISGDGDGLVASLEWRLDWLIARVPVDVIQERERQRTKWGDAHDDEHNTGELAIAASHLADPDVDDDPEDAEDEDLGWAIRLRARHHGDRRRQLVMAGALILAEIERLDRASGGLPCLTT